MLQLALEQEQNQNRIRALILVGEGFLPSEFGGLLLSRRVAVCSSLVCCRKTHVRDFV